MTGKIARLPKSLRDQVNRRIDDGERAAAIIEWLNSLPEVKALLDKDFEGIPISASNISDWRKFGYRNWKLRQTALEFNAHMENTENSPDLPQTLSKNLNQWVLLQYAAATQVVATAAEDPQANLRQLRELSADLVAFRRGDLSAGRLAIEQARLAMEQQKSDEEKEKEHWEWTKRPDIQQKLYPHRDPEKLRREVERALNRKLLGIDRPDPEPDEHADPAILI